ncbi:MAG: hypothetical protein QXT58_02185 [Archaeoglobaceae archaeon]
MFAILFDEKWMQIENSFVTESRPLAVFKFAHDLYDLLSSTVRIPIEFPCSFWEISEYFNSISSADVSFKLIHFDKPRSFVFWEVVGYGEHWHVHDYIVVVLPNGQMTIKVSLCDNGCNEMVKATGSKSMTLQLIESSILKNKILNEVTVQSLLKEKFQVKEDDE